MQMAKIPDIIGQNLIVFQESNFVASHPYFKWYLELLSPSSLGAYSWFVPLQYPYTISQG